MADETDSSALVGRRIVFLAAAEGVEQAELTEPWAAVSDALRGRRVTSYPSLATDLRNAGAEWVDPDVVVDHGPITSRRPDDLPAFCAAMVTEFARGPRREQATSG